MPVTNNMRTISAVRLGSNTAYMGSHYCAVGSVSGALSASSTGLAHYFDRNQVTGGSVDFSTNQQMSATFDFNSVEMSGLNLNQFGTFLEVSGGKALFVQGVTQQNFDGTEELRIEVNYKVV